MMTSMGGNRARGSWEQTQGQTQSQTQHKQRPQATAEQIRLAQMISDHNDADFEEKVKQLIDITGKDQDESMIALHDCNGDVNRAINVLLEGNPDTVSIAMDNRFLVVACLANQCNAFMFLHCFVHTGKAPPNLPPGVPPLLPNPYIMAPGLLHAYPVYGYDDLQMLQTRIPLDYYSIPFATPTTALTGREGSLTSNPYSGDLSKFGRGDTSSPSPATTLAQTQQNQTQTHHTTQQPFLNPALPPGYSYTSLPYYTGMPGLPNTFQYGPAVFPVAPTSSKQHGVNVGVNASATPFQQASGYGSHGYSTGYEDVGQASGSGDFCKGGYGTAVAAAASAQNKPASSVTGPGVGVSVTSSNTGVPDISGSVYTKTQSFEKQGFHAGTPTASFSLPSALGSGGPINPPAAAGYAPAPFMHILAPHQQPHSQILHHHLQQDGQVVEKLLLLHLSPSVGAGRFHPCSSVWLIWTKKRYLVAFLVLVYFGYSNLISVTFEGRGQGECDLHVIWRKRQTHS
uniref:Ubiquitin associated protein 2-like n=1 Tax=Sander lucioperca TaxID=283035 RepID=A0A8C9YRU5_SANLU